VGSLLSVHVNNARIVYFVNTHLARCVNNFLVIQQYAHVRDHSFFVIEERQVTASGFLQKTNALTLLCLHPGIAGKGLLKKRKTICTKPLQSMPNTERPPQIYGVFRYRMARAIIASGVGVAAAALYGLLVR
jgi:hypothetical protein